MVGKWEHQDMDMIIHDDIGKQVVAPAIEMSYRVGYQSSLLMLENGLVACKTPSDKVNGVLYSPMR